MTSQLLNTLNRYQYEGFTELCKQSTDRPVALTRAQYGCLADSERDDYDRQRLKWHADPPQVNTRFVSTLNRRLRRLLAMNAGRRPGEKINLAVDGRPGLGKTTAAYITARDLHRERVNEHGDTIFGPDGEQVAYLPVSLATVPNVKTNSSSKSVMKSLLHFYDSESNGNADAIRQQLIDNVTAAGTELIILDDAHSIRSRTSGSRLIADDLKVLLNHLPATLLIIGAGLTESVFWRSTGGGPDDPSEQLRLRFELLECPGYTAPTDAESTQPTQAGAVTCGDWMRLMDIFDSQLILLSHRRGSLSRTKTAQYIFHETGGNPLVAAHWIRTAAFEAIGEHERVNRETLAATPKSGLQADPQ